ncbi:Endosomal spry domain-containing protein [Rutstroemia sp. NJR-2017a BVV2]|nr:Endosomal spry domain-containing protein [Rutstroemia sp. NJR-2017a BVV2]
MLKTAIHDKHSSQSIMPPLRSYLSSLLARNANPVPSPIETPSPAHLLTRALTARDSTGTVDPSKGVTPFDTVPNKFVFVVIGLIGAGFVITGIWFFFIAKNGGFYFSENDWDDYKSTVLRRKGPNGTTLSGATESTDLGGGSIVHGQSKRSRWGRKNKKTKKNGSGMEKYKDLDEEESTVGTRSEVYSDMSEVREKSRKKSRLRGGDLGDVPDFWDNHKSTRKTQRDADTDDERIKAEAKKLQEKGRAAQRRDFSFRVGDDHSAAGSGTSLISARDAAAERERERREREERRARREARRQSRSPTKRDPEQRHLVPGSYADSSVGGSEVSGSGMGSEVSGDTGTKSYPCYIPGLSSEVAGTDYTDDRRKKRNGGYRREG